MPVPNDPFSAANVEAMRQRGPLRDPFNLPPPGLLQQLASTGRQVGGGIANAPIGGGGPSPRDLLRKLLEGAQDLPGQLYQQREAARVRREPGVPGLSPADIERIVGESQGPYGPGR